MPFIKDSKEKNSQPQNNRTKIFIGRTAELEFFTENILKPEFPKHNILSIWANGGIGKTHLLDRFLKETISHEYKDNCLAVLVDEHQSTPNSVMEKMAEQFRSLNYPLTEFEEELKNYKDTLRKLQVEREAGKEILFRKVTDLASSVASDVPVLGGVLKEGSKTATEYVLNERRNRQLVKDAQRLEDPVGKLTKIFVKDLNRIASSLVSVGFGHSKEERFRRLLLMFDTFEYSAEELAPWLLDDFLEENLNSNIVLVVAGRDPINRSSPNDPKRWLPYLDRKDIYLMPLQNFSEAETRDYLIERGINDPAQITLFWKLSGGLPLYLSLLTANSHVRVDPTTDIVSNYLRWIPEDESHKRQLALDAALLSQAFNEDDLASFIPVPVEERIKLYKWLIGLPFVRSELQGGRYSYHEQVQELFTLYLYQQSPSRYYEIRRQLVINYREKLDAIAAIGSERKIIQQSEVWSSLTLALAYQLFLLTEEAGYIEALKRLLETSIYFEEDVDIALFLRELSHKYSKPQITVLAQTIITQLLRYIEAEKQDNYNDMIEPVTYLLEKVSFPLPNNSEKLSIKLRTLLLSKRGYGYYHSGDYLKAIADFNTLIELKPDFQILYFLRALSNCYLGNFQEAMPDFNHALAEAEDDDERSTIYYFLGLAHADLGEYAPAITNLKRASELNPDDFRADYNLGRIYLELKDYTLAQEELERALVGRPNDAQIYYYCGQLYAALTDYDQAISNYQRSLEVENDDPLVYLALGIIYTDTGEYARAIENYNQALELAPELAAAYYNRGLTYSRLKDYNQASADYTKTLELEPDYIEAYNNRGSIFASSGNYEQAIIDFTSAIEFEENGVTQYFNRGTAYSNIKKYDQSLGDYNRVLEIDPEYALAYYNRGTDHFKLNKFELAAKDYLRVLELKPDFEQTYFVLKNLGVCYEQMGDVKQAVVFYEKAVPVVTEKGSLEDQLDQLLKLGDANAKLAKVKQAVETYNLALRVARQLDHQEAECYLLEKLADYYSEMAQFSEAVSCYSKIIELVQNGENSWTLEWDLVAAYFKRAQSYHDLEDYDRALADYEQVLKLDSTTAMAHLNKGSIFVDMGDLDKALKEYNQAVESEPELALAYFNRGNLYLDLKKYEQAISEYNRSLELEPAHAETYTNRGRAYQEVKNNLQAITDFSRAIEINPQFTIAYTNRGSVYYEQNEYKQAIDDFSTALSLDPSLAKIWLLRGIAYFRVEKYHTAIEDFEKVKTLEPLLASSYSSQAAAHLELKEYDLALANYDQAIKLDPLYDTNYYLRGCVYALIKEFQLAATDLSQAIKIGRNDPDVYSLRADIYLQLEKYEQALAD